MVVCATIVDDNTVGGGFGKAQRVAIARPEADGWQIERVDVRWDIAHDQVADGLHHANVARFLREQGVDVVVTGHMGGGMVKMLDSMKIKVFSGEGPLGDVLDAAVAESGADL